MVAARPAPARTPGAATAPYPPFALFAAVAAQTGRTMPPRIDRHSLPDFRPVERSRIMVAFRFFGFTDAGDVPRPALRRWADDPAVRPAFMRALIEERYAPVLALADADAPIGRMRDAIGEMGVGGSTHRRAVRFFLDAARFAGLRLPREWSRRGRTAWRAARDTAIVEAYAGGETQKQVAARYGLTHGRVQQILAAEGYSERHFGRGRPAPPPLPPAPPREPRGHERTVDLGAAGTVTLRVDADLVKLGRGDREWLFGLLDRFSHRANTCATI